jgi:hypothetical protein
MCESVSKFGLISGAVVADNDGSSLSSPSSIFPRTIDAATAKATLFPGAPRAGERPLHVVRFPGPRRQRKKRFHSQHNITH